jgi:hypothetical protein
MSRYWVEYHDFNEIGEISAYGDVVEADTSGQALDLLLKSSSSAWGITITKLKEDHNE